MKFEENQQNAKNTGNKTDDTYNILDIRLNLNAKKKDYKFGIFGHTCILFQRADE